MNFYDDNQMAAKPESPDGTLNHLRPVSMPHVEMLSLSNLACTAVILLEKFCLSVT